MDSRSKRSHTDTSADEQHGFVLQEVLASTAERSIDHDTRKSAVQRRVRRSADNLATWANVAFASLTAFVALLGEVTAECLGKSSGKVTSDTNVDGDVVLLGSAGESERVPLEVGNLGAGQEDVLAGAGGGLLLLDLDLHDVRRVLDNFVDIRDMARPDFTENTLRNPNDTADEPVALRSKAQPGPYQLDREIALTQKTPMVLNEQYGGRSG